MNLPVLDGVIDRRILVNYRVEPDVLRPLLPPNVEPLVINGYASAGICLLRLKHIGVKHSPSFLRITSENAAHRFLVSFRKNGQVTKGVYIPRRDTDSMLNVMLAGRLFSWPHYAATFHVEEGNDRFFVSMRSKDGRAGLEVDAQSASHFPADSMFDSLEHASSCFEGCAVGVSPSTNPGKLKLIELKTKTWNVRPLSVRSLKSGFFDDQSLFPHDSVAFDNALLMEQIEHEWIAG